jgi:hypothetical protein
MQKPILITLSSPRPDACLSDAQSIDGRSLVFEVAGRFGLRLSVRASGGIRLRDLDGASSGLPNLTGLLANDVSV